MESEYITDVASLDFTCVYNSIDEAAALLTAKLVTVLNHHAPWIIYQERKNFTPWIQSETLAMMRKRDEMSKSYGKFS